MNINNGNALQNRKIIIFATLPPPYGGISVHVKRLIDIAKKEGVPVKLYDWRLEGENIKNISYANPTLIRIIYVLRFLLSFKEPIIHFHNNGIHSIIVSILLVFFRRKKILLTIHGERIISYFQNSSCLVRYFLKKALMCCDHIFCVSNSIKAWVDSLGCPSNATSLTSAFIKPTENEISENNLSVHIKNFISLHSPIIGTHGWFGSFLGDKDVYSFELICEMAAILREKYPNCGIYTVVSGTFSKEHRKKIFLKKSEMGLENDWVIFEEPFNAAALFFKTDLFVRPTITDGDSLSIRECLSLGVPVVASDAVSRPKGCILFRSLDLSDLVEKTKNALDDYKYSYKKTSLKECYKDGSDEVIEIYKRTLSFE